jgi:hypothetical protein
MRLIDDIYQSDAYHSLSIDGYSVSMELIERVRAGNWNPESHDADRQNRDALAARGYWQAFQVVRADVEEIIAGANPARVIRTSHRGWFPQRSPPVPDKQNQKRKEINPNPKPCPSGSPQDWNVLPAAAEDARGRRGTQ